MTASGKQGVAPLGCCYGLTRSISLTLDIGPTLDISLTLDIGLTLEIPRAWLQGDEENEFGFAQLMENGIIELIDAAEEDTTLIAMTVTDLAAQREEQSYHYTHCEIHPAMILGTPSLSLCACVMHACCLFAAKSILP